jgi:hypothetical protein
MSTPRAIKPSSRPALRLVSTKGMNREQWLKVRKQRCRCGGGAQPVSVAPGAVDDQDRSGWPVTSS